MSKVEVDMDNRREQGSNLVEMALGMFILVLLIAAIADFGRAFNHYIVITNASRAGARFGARMEHTSTVDSYIRNAVIGEARNSGVDLGEPEAGQPRLANITIEPLWDSRSVAQPITVTVEYTVTTLLTGIVGIDKIPMRSQTVMVMYGNTLIPEGE